MRFSRSFAGQKISRPTCRLPAAFPLPKALRARRSEAGITLVETVISLMIILIGLAGLFATSAQSFTLLRRSKETVAIRECLMTRLDTVRALSFAEVAKSSYMSQNQNVMAAGTSGDPNPFGVTITGIQGFTETVTVYALGAQLFSSDAQRQNATPDYQDEVASQVDTIAPAAPTTYKANSASKGDWTQQVAGALPYYQITRVGSGASATVTVDNATSTGDLTAYPSVRVDVTYTWTDSSKVTRTQVGCIIVSRNGSLQ
jgi:type II secretory pathway pseudopilin PulG